MVNKTENPVALLYQKFNHLTIKFKKRENIFTLSLICPISKDTIKVVSKSIISRKKTKNELANEILNDPNLSIG